MKHNFLAATLAVSVILFSCTQTSPRQVISLNGKWEIAKTGGELPDVFTSTAPVPGVVDLATPALDPPDAFYKDSSWYWHKRTFNLPGTDFDVIRLKVYKAKYHTKVYVNGQFVGENEYCFTPSYYDIKPFLLPASQSNEILIGVGSFAEMPDSVHAGHDHEKIRYIPGIYDQVEITLSDKPFIENIQCVPDIKNSKLRVVAEIDCDNPSELTLDYTVAEAVSGKKIASKSFSPQTKTENGYAIADFEVDMKGAKRWTPETPFLYELTLNTGKDSKTVRFGMRSFRFDTVRNVALLNEEPYYLRGTNVALFRFMEDTERKSLPWDTQWVVKLHERFKDFHWNISRFHISFAPERWYEICDSIGFLVVDEYPVWGVIERTAVSLLAEEYRRWMRERWNHPCMVMWDAQNETVTHKTAAAIRMVRRLDLSNRPWDNGYSEPVAETDPIESHPYLFLAYPDKGQNGRAYELDYNDTVNFRREVFGRKRKSDFNSPNDLSIAATSRKNAKATDTATVMFNNPCINNEYGWLWLDRDGNPTPLTVKIYKMFWHGKTPQERFYIYARYEAMLTEYWRASRSAASVQHFCSIGSFRPLIPRSVTSDNWTDIGALTYEPNFYKYVRPAFAPVGLMIDNVWEKSYPPASKLTVPVHVINDLKTAFEQDIVLTVLKDDKVIATYKQPVSAKGYEVSIATFEITLPAEAGDYLIKAEIILDGENVFSLRDVAIK
jgi:hypothetical protein